MSTDLRELLRDAAGEAPAPDVRDVWRAGRARAHRRRAAVAGGVVAAAVAVVGVAVVLGTAPSTVPPVDSTPEVSPSPTTSGLSPADPQLPPGQSLLRSRGSAVADEFDLLARPGGGPLQLLTVPALAGRTVMLADGTLVHEGVDPDAPGGGDPAVWTVPYAGGPALRLQPGTDTPGQRVLLGRDDGGRAAVVLLADGTVEAWRPDGSPTVVGRVADLPGDVRALVGSWNGSELVLARRGSTEVHVSNEASGEDGPLDVSPDGQHEVRDLAHVGEDVIVLLGAVGEGQDRLLRFGPRTRDAPDVVELGGGPDAVALAVHDGIVAVHRRYEGGAWAPSVLVEPGGSVTVLEEPGPLLLHDEDPVPAAVGASPSCDPAVAAGASSPRTVPVWLPCGSTVVEVERTATAPATDTADEVRARLAVLFEPLPPDGTDAGFDRPWGRDPVGSVTMDGTTAVVDLAASALEGFPGGATLAAAQLHEAVARTATAVEGVGAVTFRLDGSCEAWAAWNEATGCVTVTAADLAARSAGEP